VAQNVSSIIPRLFLHPFIIRLFESRGRTSGVVDIEEEGAVTGFVDTEDTDA